MAVAEWSFVYCDRDSVPQGEILNVAERKVALPLNSLSTASFKIRLDNPLAEPMMSLEGFVKAYRNGVLMFHGLLLSCQESIDHESATCVVNCIDCGWLLNKRYAGKSKTGTVFGAMARSQIVETLILVTANLDGPLGVDALSVPNGAQGGLMTGYTAGPYKLIYEILKEMSAGTDGFDWRFLPVENYVDGAVVNSPYGDPYKSQFYASTVIGEQKPDAVFEFGVGRNNVHRYERQITRETQANKIYNNAQAGPDAPGYPTVSALDAASVEDWYLMEDLVAADLVTQTHRQTLVNAHRDVRAQPRQVVNFVPHIDDGTGRVPELGQDFDLGDQIRGRFAYNNMMLLDAYMRLYGVSYEIDSEGTERSTFTLIQEG